MARRKKKPSGGSSSVIIGGSVNISGGDFVGGDKIVTASSGAIYVDGDANEAILDSGEHNTGIQQSEVRKELFDDILREIDQRYATSFEVKKDLEVNVREVETEAGKDEEADGTFLADRLRNIMRMAPDIADVVLAAIADPSAGFAMVVKKVAERASRS